KHREDQLDSLGVRGERGRDFHHSLPGGSFLAIYFHHGGMPGVVIHVSKIPHRPDSAITAFQYGAKTKKNPAMNIVMLTNTPSRPTRRTHHRFEFWLRLMSFSRASAVIRMRNAGMTQNS